MKKTLALLMCLAMVVSVLAACGGGATTTAGNTDATTTAATTTGATTTAATTQAAAEDFNETGVLNILWHGADGTDGKFECTYMDYQSSIPDLIYDSLIKLDMEDNSKYIPRMAEKWEISADGLTYTFHIRETLNWSDGQPVMASDFLWSVKAKVGSYGVTNDRGTWDYVVGMKEFVEGTADDIAGITADGKTLTFQLTDPWNNFMLFLASFNPYPEHCFPADIDFAHLQEAAYWQKPVHCGPYLIESVSFPDLCVLTRNEDWYGPKPAIKTIHGVSFDSSGGSEAGVAALISGTLDFVHGNEYNDAALCENVASQNSEMKIVRFPSAFIRFVAPNLVGSSDGKHNKWVKDVKFRQALSMAIDREAITTFIPNGTVVTTNVNPNSDLYNKSVPLWTRDVEGAKALLAEIGYDGTPVRFVEYYNDKTTADIMAVIIANLEDVGIPAEHLIATGNLNQILYEALNYDYMYAGYNCLNGIEAYQLNTTGSNYDKYLGEIEYRKGRYDPILNEYRVTSDPARLKELADTLQQYQMEDCYTIPFYAIDKLVMFNAAKIQFDPAWETCNDLAIYRNVDLRLENWKLLKA